MTVAALGFQIDTGPVAKAVSDLDRLTAATAKAEAETRKVFRVDNAASQYAQRIDNSARALRGFEAIAAKTAATAKHVTDQMMRMTAHELRNMDIQAYGQELDRLRAKFNPVFAASKRYEQELNELNRAHKVGAINASEHGAALTALNARYQATGTAAATMGAQSRMAQQHARNLAFQFQDIGTMLAAGQSPFMLLAQQLPQVTMYGGRLTGVMGALKSSLAGLISPLGLVTTGFVLAASAAISYFSSGSEAKTLTDALDNHTSALDKVRGMYGRAGSAADRFGRESTTQLAAMERRARAAVEEMSRLANIDLSKALSDDGGWSGFGLLHGMWMPAEVRAIRLEFAAFAEPIARIRQEIAAGTPNFDEFQQAIEDIVATRPGLRATADEVLNLANESINVARWLGDTANELRNSSPEALAYATAMRDLQAAVNDVSSATARDELQSLVEKTTEGELGLDDLIKALGKLSENSPDLQSHVEEIARLGLAADITRKKLEAMYAPLGGNTVAGGKTGRLNIVQLPETVSVTPTTRVDPYFEDWRKKTPKSQAERDAERAKKAYADMVRDSEQFIAAQRLEQEAMFMTEEAANALRYEQELLNQAANDNIKLTPEMSAELRKLATDMAATEAETTRLQDALKFGKDLVRGFVSDLRSGLEQGKGFWRSFADAALNALDKVVDKIMDDLINALFEANKVGSSGGIIDWIINLVGGGRLKLPGTAPIPTSRPAAAAAMSAGFGLTSSAVTASLASPSIHRALPAGNINSVPRPYLPAATRGSVQGGGVTVNVQNNSGAKVEVGDVKRGSDGSLSIDMMVNEIEARMEGSMRGGRLGRAAQQTFGLQRRVR